MGLTKSAPSIMSLTFVSYSSSHCFRLSNGNSDLNRSLSRQQLQQKAEERRRQRAKAEKSDSPLLSVGNVAERERNRRQKCDSNPCFVSLRASASSSAPQESPLVSVSALVVSWDRNWTESTRSVHQVQANIPWGLVSCRLIYQDIF
jgi:hypothetical protein